MKFKIPYLNVDYKFTSNMTISPLHYVVENFKIKLVRTDFSSFVKNRKGINRKKERNIIFTKIQIHYILLILTINVLQFIT